jgi:putative glycosyltransferase (TIGR04348 family)
MRIEIVTPAPPGSNYGNRITAVRWARILKQLGHRVSISQSYNGNRADLLVALHARRSFQSIKSFHRQKPDRPLVVTLTGTDVYRDLRTNQRANEALEMATRIVALQPKALERLEPRVRAKTRVIYQSVNSSARNSGRAVKGKFDVCVVGHLRNVKDPFRAALASRLLPYSSRVQILQIGGAMTQAMAMRAQAEARRNPRYKWLDEVSRPRALQYLRRSRLCVLSSRMEGGANALSEAIVAGVPVLASRIDGNVGILGPDYPGLFEVGNTVQLAKLLERSETDRIFLNVLRERIKRLAPLFNPKRELRDWANLIRELQDEANERTLA